MLKRCVSTTKTARIASKRTMRFICGLLKVLVVITLAVWLRFSKQPTMPKNPNATMPMLEAMAALP